ncbi:mucin-5AC [Drosophila navojoa]|uniref:mucin-5AC n=1 Tax=Drosophila navojoa TaxID=7232 RepID=UPI00084751A0|nr:mucin-5AC [Drosophila navojoa]
MSSMKGGFTTLNRWFGRKKDKSGVGSANGKLSKSTTQLHHMSTDQGIHINEASQLDYNRITPLPAATSNAPFEQTFRITVLLPKDQLYVTRLGARVPLSKLLSLVCDNKQLDPDKYEFRNPVDASQVYSCESSIGAVGLSEIRLCHKSESYDSFNADSMLKFQRTGGTRDSLSSSSEFSSSRHSHSKLTAKTPSPYSSSNSLNSMDSTGMNYTRTPVVPPKALSVAPPPRKKRVAPRPPSQVAIPEQSVAQFNETPTPTATPAPTPTEPAYAVIVKRPQLCMSTPNLASTPEHATEAETQPSFEVDCNGNSAKTLDGGHYATLERRPYSQALPEPTPRKRLLQLKKKTAPAPPPESPGPAAEAGAEAATAAADTISLASSTTVSMTEVLPAIPQPAPRITTPVPVATSTAPRVQQQQQESEAVPPALPTTAAPQMLSNGSQNVSKVLLNRTPTPEPRSLGSATEEEEDNNDTASKQADSGIGEPVPSPLPSSSPSPEPEVQPLADHKAQLESSSEEDDEAIKVYNFKTSCKSSVKVKELVLSAQQLETAADEQPSPLSDTPLAQTPSSPNSELTSLSSWNYAGPISPPPDFSDSAQFADRQRPKSSEVVNELSSIIQQQRLDTLIRQAPEQPQQIEAAKPNRLANFSIASISNGSSNKRNSSNNSNNSSNNSNNSNNSSSSSSPTITRTDSFQSPRHSHNGSSLGMRLRSSSQLSLNRLELNGLNGGLQQRRSSSELSIGESPSLQSLELIKTILSNSRKNSLATDAADSTEARQSQLAESEKPKSRSTASPTAKPVSMDLTTPASPLESTVASPTIVTPKAVPVSTVVSHTNEHTSVAKEAVPVPVPVPTVEPAADATSAPSAVTAAVATAVPAEKSTAIATKVPLAQPVAAPTSASKLESPVSTPPANPQAAVPIATARKASLQEAPTTEPEPKPEPEPEPEREPVPEVVPEPAAKPLPQTYRYSGPPSINFATWSERPKSQVAIKNEGDYIYGGARAGTAPKPATAPVKLTIEVASPILRMGIPRKEYHVPITVKPLRDDSQEQERASPEPEQEKPPVQQEVMVKPSTLPRPAKSNRFTLPASVQSNSNSNSINNYNNNSNSKSGTTNSLPRPISTLEKVATPAAPVEPAAAPFGQNTLRRTGFKERMLAKEQKEHEQALSVRVSVNGTTSPAPVAAVTTAPAVKPATPTPAATPTSPLMPKLRSTKVELKLETVEPKPAPNALQVKLRPVSYMANKSTATPTPTAAASATGTPSPPPPPPMLSKAKAMPKLKATTPTSASPSADPRDQLLEAIRNFKREELNRA